ncbi:MAG: FixH family protein [Chloroflexi bacterium]|nr:FixH family protein [Chloroflexota bacterium]
MNRNLIVLTLVLGGIVLFAGGLLTGFMAAQFSFGPLAVRQMAQGYGPGMMGGGTMRGSMMGQGMTGQGMMGQGMMGGYGYNATPVAPGNVPAAPTATANPPSDTKAPAPTTAPTSAPTAVPNSGGGRGTTNTARSGGGLVAVSPNGAALPKDSNLPDNTAAQKVGNLNVTLAISPYPPASFQQGTFDITLADAEGKAITDAKVSLDLTMPAMWMPPSKPEAQSIGSGKYRASARWTMRGQWRIEVIITRGSEKQSAFFDVWL